MADSTFQAWFQPLWAEWKPAEPAPDISSRHRRDIAFATAVAKAFATARIKRACSYKTIESWRKGNLPRNPREILLTILHVALGREPTEAEQARLDALLPPDPPSKPTTAAGGKTRAPTSHAGFLITGRHEAPGLVELKVNPAPGNSDETFRLDAVLRFGILPHDHEDQSIEIALSDAEISIESATYQPIQGSPICDRTDHPYLKPRSGLIGVIGPIEREALSGDPLGLEHLAVMQRVEDEESAVIVEIRARTRTVIVRDESTGTPVSTNRQAIIEAILGEGEKRTPTGRLVFARARIRRRPTS
jgi:hypothetical protein